MTAHLRTQWRTAGSSWRGFPSGTVWLDHDAVILSDGGPGGRKHYEVYDGGNLVASRGSLREAQQYISERWGTEPTWSTLRQETIESPVHYHFGPMPDLQTPTTIWVAER
jgi:hypothetical protein